MKTKSDASQLPRPSWESSMAATSAAEHPVWTRQTFVASKHATQSLSCSREDILLHLHLRRQQMIS